MDEHLTAGVTEYSSSGVKHTPLANPPAESPQWNILAGLWEERRVFQGEPVLVAVGPTGYLDQCRPEGFDRALTAVVDEYGRKGIAVKTVRDDGKESLEVLFQRYSHPGPVVGGSAQFRVMVVGVFDAGAQRKFETLCSGMTVFDCNGRSWTLATD